jgi:hypothetical protein
VKYEMLNIPEAESTQHSVIFVSKYSSSSELLSRMKIPVHIQFGLSYILEFGDYIISIF